MTPSKTFAEIFADTLIIEPKSAFAYRNSPDAINFCSTGIYTHYLTDSGDIEQLKLVDGKYAAVYVRVSTDNQKSDGWSINDQAKRGIQYCLDKKLAFRVFNDGGLSGKMPVDNPELILSMRLANAKRYERAYKSVFFSDNRYESEKTEMLAWLEMYKNAIQKGTKSLNQDYEESGTKKIHAYRPALTEMMKHVDNRKIHTLLLTDISRLSRSQALMVELTKSLQRNDVNIVGLIETLDFYNNDEEMGNVIISNILTTLAEFKLKEITVNVIRGLVERLESGEHHGTLPHWLIETPNGLVVDEKKANAIRNLVDFIIENPKLGYMRLAEHMNSNPSVYPLIISDTHTKLRDRWLANTVRLIITNPNLIGYQESFGRKWFVLPPIIEKRQWDELQRIQDERSDKKIIITSRKPNHLLTMVLSCQCGKAMSYNQSSQEGIQARYRCSDMVRIAGISRNHVSFIADEVETFVNNLIQEQPQFLINAIEKSLSNKTIVDEIKDLKEQKTLLSSLLKFVRERAEQTTRDKLQSVNIPAIEAILTAAIETDEDVIAAKNELSEIQSGIDERQYILNTTVSSSHVADLKQRLKQWNELDMEQKNIVIRKLIYTIRINKTDDGFKLVIVQNIPKRTEFTPVYTIKKRGKRGKSYDGLPTVDDWINNAFI